MDDQPFKTVERETSPINNFFSLIAVKDHVRRTVGSEEAPVQSAKWQSGSGLLRAYVCLLCPFTNLFVGDKSENINCITH